MAIVNTLLYTYYNYIHTTYYTLLFSCSKAEIINVYTAIVMLHFSKVSILIQLQQLENMKRCNKHYL